MIPKRIMKIPDNFSKAALGILWQQTNLIQLQLITLISRVIGFKFYIDRVIKGIKKKVL